MLAIFFAIKCISAKLFTSKVFKNVCMRFRKYLPANTDLYCPSDVLYSGAFENLERREKLHHGEPSHRQRQKLAEMAIYANQWTSQRTDLSSIQSRYFRAGSLGQGRLDSRQWFSFAMQDSCRHLK